MDAQTIKLSGRLLKRDWFSGELRILVFALVIAITATTGISFLTERLSRALLNQSAELIGGDLVLQSSRPLKAGWLEQGKVFGADTAAIAEFSSVIMRGDEILLASVRAVSDSYPLRGALRVTDQPYGQDVEIREPPGSGEVWVDQRVLNRLSVNIGDSVQIGASQFKISRILTFEPDRGGDFFNLAPRVLMNLTDLEATAIVQPGSRVRYKFLYAGGDAEKMRQWLTPQLGVGQSIIDIKSGRRGAGKALERAEQFLGLASLLAVVLAAIAIAVTTRRYSERHYDVSAMMRCLGASEKMILQVYALQLFLLACICGLLGCLGGWGLQWLLVTVLKTVLPAELPFAGFKPVVIGFVTGFIILLGTALPPILRLAQVSPLRVLRRQMTPLPVNAWIVYLLALAAIFLLSALLVNNLLLALAVFAGMVFIALLLAACVYWIMKVDWFKGSQTKGLAQQNLLIRGVKGLSRHAKSNAIQIAAFGITAMLMLVLFISRTELLDNWRAQLPADVPNHFAYNILPSEKTAAENHLKAAGIKKAIFYPMVRGRLTEINNEPVRQLTQKRGSDEAINRELNLTWADELPADNAIIAGQWQPGSARENNQEQLPGVSVESELAERLKIRLDDMLTFNIAGRELQAKVTSLRTVKWESFTPNFYMMFAPGALDSFPATYVTSFRIENESRHVLARLVRNFPSITVIDVGFVVTQIQNILQQVILAVEVMLLFVLLAGFAVLFAGVQSSIDERVREGALIRALGASRRYLNHSNLAEFMLMGFISGILAVVGMEAVNLYIYRAFFDLPYRVSYLAWLFVPCFSAVLIACTGYWSTRSILQESPMVLLRQ